MSIVASYVIAGVILIRLFIKKAPKIFSYALWSIVAFRLLCPFSFESAISLIPKSFETTPQTVSYLQNVNISLSTIHGGNIVNRINQVILPAAAETKQAINLADILQIIWLTGILLILAAAILSYVRIKRKISTATLVKDNIYETDLIHTPFVIGFIKPKIYILTGMQKDELDYILLHEQTHIRHRDYWIKPLAFIVLAVYWFNPVIWIAYILMARDMEMACDESVIKHTKEENKGTYSNLLLSLSIKKSGLMNPLSFGQNNIKTRIKNILHYKKPAKWLAGCICLLIALTTVLMTSNPIMAKNKIAIEDFIGINGSLIGISSSTVEDIVNSYLDNMKNQNIAGIIEMLKSKEYGYDAKVYNYAVENHYAAVPEGSVSVDELIAGQADFIRKKFGENAWENVTYKIEKSNCPAKKEGYVNKETGEVLSLQKYLEYIGISQEDYETHGFPSPVNVVLVDAYEYYLVYFSFNGADSTADGENTFKISVGNENGDYEIRIGLRWYIPLSPENAGRDV
ncbi:MAG: M56 family metallopeptidase [Patescibacteria group bacterium]